MAIRRDFLCRLLRSAAWLILAGAAAWAQSPAVGKAAATPSSSSSTWANSSGARPSASPNPSAPVVERTVARGTEGADYVIGPDDVLSIHVWHEAEMSGSIPVRPDGKISFPLIGEVQAAGLTPARLQEAISGRLKAYVSEPEVVVIVQQFNSRKYNVLGEVKRPGTFPLGAHTDVIDALATAGGFTDFAKVGKVYVVRRVPGGSSEKIRFSYKHAISGKGNERIELQPGDTVIVP